MYHGIKNVDGFDSLFIGDFAYFKSCFNVTEAPWSMPAFSLFSAKYISSMAKISGAGIKLASHGFTDIYENSNCMEPAFLVKYPFEIAVAGMDKAKDLIASKTFNPMKTLILEGPDAVLTADLKGIENDNKSSGEARASLTMPDPNSYTVKTDSPAAGVLVLTDNYYPGWRAYVDGVETRIMKVDLTFKGVFLKKGIHEVDFKYSPPEFFIGAIVSIVLLMLLLPVVPFLLKLF
jgi:hypothetical protein